MKRNPFIFAMTIIVIILTHNACEHQIENVLPRQQGSWRVTHHVANTYTNGQYVGQEEIDDYGTLTFDNDGTGYGLLDGDELNFLWSVPNDSQVYMANAEDESLSITFDVLECEKNSQRWTGEIASMDIDPASGIIIHYLEVITWDLVRD